MNKLRKHHNPCFTSLWSNYFSRNCFRPCVRILARLENTASILCAKQFIMICWAHKLFSVSVAYNAQEPARISDMFSRYVNPLLILSIEILAMDYNILPHILYTEASKEGPLFFQRFQYRHDRHCPENTFLLKDEEHREHDQNPEQVIDSMNSRNGACRIFGQMCEEDWEGSSCVSRTVMTLKICKQICVGG